MKDDSRPEHPLVTATRKKVVAARAHWPTVQGRAQVSRSWLHQFARGTITNPTIDTLSAVSAACDEVLLPQLPAAESRPAVPA
jgi:hypothetical protein